MKGTKNPFLPLVGAMAIALLIGGCGGGGSDDTAGTTPPVVTPQPEPMGPTDLEETQAEAAAAAMAAMTASTSADTAADGAETATMHIATLQTNGMAMMYAMDARKYAEMAMAEYMKAKAASEAAAAATTGDAGEAAWRMAVTAQEAAEGAADMAADKAMKATKAAMTELHIDGTVKTVGESSVDATSGMVTSPDSKMVTGLLIGGEPDRTTAMSPGQHFIQRGGPATETKYKQAVAAGSVDIGKVLDTSDDTARLTLITSREGKKKVRVFVDRAPDAVNDDGTNALLDQRLDYHWRDAPAARDIAFWRQGGAARSVL